jgi:hypothetical protein
MTFTQLTARLKNFLRGWMLVMGLKEYRAECVTVCIKSEVILESMVHDNHTAKSDLSQIAELCCHWLKFM